MSRDTEVLKLIANLYKGGLAEIGMVHDRDEGKQDNI
jgi:hypothetical protein